MSRERTFSWICHHNFTIFNLSQDFGVTFRGTTHAHTLIRTSFDVVQNMRDVNTQNWPTQKKKKAPALEIDTISNMRRIMWLVNIVASQSPL